MSWFQEKSQTFVTITIWLARAVFAGLVFFELLNVLKIIELNTQYTWLGLLLTAIASFVGVEAAAYRFRKLKGEALHWSVWLIVTAALSLDAFGDFFHLYGKYGWWDRLVHGGVSAAVCFILFVVITAFWLDHFQFNLLFRTGRVRLAMFMAATSTLSISVIYEIEEYVEDMIFGSNRLGPGIDTADDLLFNFLGVIAAILLVGGYYFIKKRLQKSV